MIHAIPRPLPIAATLLAAIFLAAQGPFPLGVMADEPPHGLTVAAVALEPDTTPEILGSDVEVQMVDVVAGPEPAVLGRRGLRIRTLRPLKNFWEAQITSATTGPVHRGQPGLVTFWARTLDSPPAAAPGHIAVYFQRSSEPRDKSFLVKREVPRRWTLFQVPFRAHESFAAADAQLCLGFGFDPQTVEVAEIRAEVFPASVPLETLPNTPQMPVR